MSSIKTLDDLVHRQSSEDKAAQALEMARFKLVMSSEAKSAFFAVLVLRLTILSNWQVETAVVNGKAMLYNPDFICELSLAELQSVLAHEVLHCVFGHPYRQGDRALRKWNIACDLSINQILLEAGFTLPNGRLMAGEAPHENLPLGLAAEEYYDLLSDDPHDDGDDPGGCGGSQRADDNSQTGCEQGQLDWQTALAQADQIARQRGQLPGGLDRLVAQALHPKVNWKDELREFVRAQSRNDFSWSSPNRRFIHMGLYLPGLRSEELGVVLIAVDTSASIREEQLALFAGEAQGALEAYSCTATIVYHDSRIAHVQQWSPCDGPLILGPKGGGGTSHFCVFEHAEEMSEPPVCVLCLTDCYTVYPDKHPDMPVLWCVTKNKNASPPFGRVVMID